MKYYIYVCRCKCRAVNVEGGPEFLKYAINIEKASKVNVSAVSKEHVQDEEAVLHCGLESSKLIWNVHNGNDVDIIAADGDTVDDSKYTVSKNPPLTGLYYRLHILNV